MFACASEELSGMTTARRYALPPEVQRGLLELTSLTRPHLLERCRARGADRLGGELLTAISRAAGHGDRSLFGVAYASLEDRLSRLCRTWSDPQGPTPSDVIERVLDRLRDLMARDLRGGCPSLDFFEVRFHAAAASLRRDAWNAASRGVSRKVPLLDGEGRIAREVEVALGRGTSDHAEEAERHRLEFVERMVGRLDPLGRSILELTMDGLPVTSTDPTVQTIVGRLGRSERSVRSHRERAYRSIRYAYERARGGGTRRDRRG